MTQNLFKKKMLFIITVGFLLTACGYKGPLYLPETKTNQQQTGKNHAHEIHKNARLGE